MMVDELVLVFDGWSDRDLRALGSSLHRLRSCGSLPAEGPHPLPGRSSRTPSKDGRDAALFRAGEVGRSMVADRKKGSKKPGRGTSPSEREQWRVTYQETPFDQLPWFESGPQPLRRSGGGGGILPERLLRRGYRVRGRFQCDLSGPTRIPCARDRHLPGCRCGGPPAGRPGPGRGEIEEGDALDLPFADGMLAGRSITVASTPSPSIGGRSMPTRSTAPSVRTEGSSCRGSRGSIRSRSGRDTVLPCVRSSICSRIASSSNEPAFSRPRNPVHPRRTSRSSCGGRLSILRRGERPDPGPSATAPGVVHPWAPRPRPRPPEQGQDHTAAGALRRQDPAPTADLGLDAARVPRKVVGELGRAKRGARSHRFGVERWGHRVHHVVSCDDTHQPATFDHGKPVDAVLPHQPEALLQRVVGLHLDDPRAHHLSNLSRVQALDGALESVRPLHSLRTLAADRGSPGTSSAPPTGAAP